MFKERTEYDKKKEVSDATGNVDSLEFGIGFLISLYSSFVLIHAHPFSSHSHPRDPCQLSTTFISRVLSHPTREGILHRLSSHPSSVTLVDTKVHLLHFAITCLNVLVIVNCYNPMTACMGAPLYMICVTL